MKKIFFTLLFIGILFYSIPIFGQKTVVVVEPDAGLDVGALNNAINTAEDPGNKIFELRRDGVYYLNGAISHSGYTLHIRAEEGSGTRPVLQPAVDENGASSNHFNPGGPLILEGLHIHGINELGALVNRLIIVSGVENRITVDDCYVDYADQVFIRLTSTMADVSISNSIIRNLFRPENTDNGRVIDTRGNVTDTLSLVNSTFYNNAATIVSTGAGMVTYINMDHNTFFQFGLKYNLNLRLTYKADITNNILYNFGYRANNYSHQPLFSIDSMFTIGEYNDAGRYFNLSNNNWYIDPVIGEIIDDYGPQDLVRYAEWDTEKEYPIPWKWVLRTDLFANQSILDTATVTLPPNFIRFIENGQVDTSNIFREKLYFTNAPPLNLDYWKFYVENNFEVGSLNPPSPFADEDSLVLGEVTTGAYDFSYNDNSRSATSATGGLPLGDPRWVPYTTVSTKDMGVNSTSSGRIYPNPFADNVIFEFNAQKAGSVIFKVYDMLGKEVFSLTENINPGNNNIPVNFCNNLKDGIYLYSVHYVSNGTFTSIATGKMVKR